MELVSSYNAAACTDYVMYALLAAACLLYVINAIPEGNLIILL